MKLPDFSNFEPFNDIRKRMKASLTNEIESTTITDRLTQEDFAQGEVIEPVATKIEQLQAAITLPTPLPDIPPPPVIKLQPEPIIIPQPKKAKAPLEKTPLPAPVIPKKEPPRLVKPAVIKRPPPRPAVKRRALPKKPAAKKNIRKLVLSLTAIIGVNAAVIGAVMFYISTRSAMDTPPVPQAPAPQAVATPQTKPPPPPEEKPPAAPQVASPAQQSPGPAATEPAEASIHHPIAPSSQSMDSMPQEAQDMATTAITHSPIGPVNTLQTTETKPIVDSTPVTSPYRLRNTRPPSSQPKIERNPIPEDERLSFNKPPDQPDAPYAIKQGNNKIYDRFTVRHYYKVIAPRK